MADTGSFTRELGRLYKSGEAIYTQGDSAEGLFVVQKGHVEVVLATQEGERVINRLGKGDVFGETSLFADKARFTTARADGDARVLMVDQKTFVARLHQDPSLSYRIIRQMSQRIYELDHELMQRLCSPARAVGPDKVTGRPAFPNADELLEDEVARAKRLMQALAFAVIDVDNFKAIRKNHGLGTANLVMTTLSEILGELVRKTDVVGRYGKDRFGVILYEADGRAAVRVLEKIRKKFTNAQFKTAGGKKCTPTFSAGVAVMPEYDEAVTLRTACNEALMKAQKKGGDQIILAEGGGDAKYPLRPVQRLNRSDLPPTLFVSETSIIQEAEEP